MPSMKLKRLRNHVSSTAAAIVSISGGTIPLHLLTKEAFEIYLQHLNQGGIIAINVSNNYFDLPPAVFKLAEEFNLSAALIEDRGDGLQSYDSIWVLLAREHEGNSLGAKQLVEVDDVIELAVSRTMEQGGNVEIVADNPDLEEAGNIGALLQY